MGKTRMVTRTVNTLMVTVMAVNLETAEVETRTVEIVGNSSKDEKKILSTLEKDKSILGETIKAVKVIDVTPIETIYGMSEQEFITIAKRMDEKRHIIEE